LINTKYPEEWNKLPRKDRKKLLKDYRKNEMKRQIAVKRIGMYLFWLFVFGILVFGVWFFTKEEEVSPEKVIIQKALSERVEEFPIEGRDHVGTGVEISYETNPPTSGSHLAKEADWGIYEEELDDRAVVHSIEHGGFWISYKDLTEEEVVILEKIAKNHPDRVVLSPRSKNDDRVVIVSWGRMVRLDEIDELLISEYIDKYVNDSPEKLVR